jgi:hypothetical protein
LGIQIPWELPILIIRVLIAVFILYVVLQPEINYIVLTYQGIVNKWGLAVGLIKLFSELHAAFLL